MNTETFEQEAINENFSDNADFLQEGMEIEVFIMVKINRPGRIAAASCDRNNLHRRGS